MRKIVRVCSIQRFDHLCNHNYDLNFNKICPTWRSFVLLECSDCGVNYILHIILNDSVRKWKPRISPISIYIVLKKFTFKGTSRVLKITMFFKVKKNMFFGKGICLMFKTLIYKTSVVFPCKHIVRIYRHRGHPILEIKYTLSTPVCPCTLQVIKLNHWDNSSISEINRSWRSCCITNGPLSKQRTHNSCMTNAL